MSVDSTVTYLKDGVKRGMNPFRSRSTVICLSCLVTLIIINMICMRAGYYSSEFAAMSFLVLREMIAASLNHQAKTEQKNEK